MNPADQTEALLFTGRTVLKNEQQTFWWQNVQFKVFIESRTCI